MSNYKNCINDLNEAVRLNPDYAKAYLKRGDINMIQENYDDAVRDYTKAHEHDHCKYH